MKEVLLDVIITGQDLENQGTEAVSHARMFLSDLVVELSKSGPTMVNFGLPLARRVMSDPVWQQKASVPDLVTFCESRISQFPQGIEENQPSLVEVVSYLEDCAREYTHTW